MAEENDQYHITEEDIEWVIKHMDLNLHKKVTRDQAIKILNQLHSRQKTLERLDPDAIEEELKNLEEY